MRKLLFLLMVFVVTISSTMAQKTVTGTVTAENAPLPGATVVVKGTTVGTVTGSDGNYTLSIPANAKTLLFSFIGMKTQEIEIGTQSTISVTLMPDVIGLEEVVAIGYGTMKKSDLTGAVSTVKSSQVENEKPQALQDMLRGNIAGLQVGFATTAKGGGDMEIRGDNTLKASSNPLVVLDGVIYQGALEDINPNDIESIDVLKDASSAAVYGSRSANGVILVTTKKGVRGKPVINVNSSIGLATMGTLEEVYQPYEFISWRTHVMQSLNYYNSATNTKLYKFEDPNNLPEGVTKEMWLDGSAGDETDIWLARLGMLPLEIANYKAGKSVDWTDMVFQNGLLQKRSQVPAADDSAVERDAALFQLGTRPDQIHMSLVRLQASDTDDLEPPDVPDLGFVSIGVIGRVDAHSNNLCFFTHPGTQQVHQVLAIEL